MRRVPTFTTLILPLTPNSYHLLNLVTLPYPTEPTRLKPHIPFIRPSRNSSYSSITLTVLPTLTQPPSSLIKSYNLPVHPPSHSSCPVTSVTLHQHPRIQHLTSSSPHPSYPPYPNPFRSYSTTPHILPCTTHHLPCILTNILSSPP